MSTLQSQIGKFVKGTLEDAFCEIYVSLNSSCKTSMSSVLEQALDQMVHSYFAFTFTKAEMPDLVQTSLVTNILADIVLPDKIVIY